MFPALSTRRPVTSSQRGLSGCSSSLLFLVSWVLLSQKGLDLVNVDAFSVILRWPRSFCLLSFDTMYYMKLSEVWPQLGIPRINPFDHGTRPSLDDTALGLLVSYWGFLFVLFVRRCWSLVLCSGGVLSGFGIRVILYSVSEL